MIWAVIRSASVEPVSQTLKSMGVTGCTVSPVRGYGEEWHLYEPLIHGGHYKLETIVEDDQVERVVTQIAEKACTGMKGDGLISVIDLGKIVQIRLKGKGASKQLSTSESMGEGG